MRTWARSTRWGADGAAESSLPSCCAEPRPVLRPCYADSADDRQSVTASKGDYPSHKCLSKIKRQPEWSIARGFQRCVRNEQPTSGDFAATQNSRSIFRRRRYCRRRRRFWVVFCRFMRCRAISSIRIGEARYPICRSHRHCRPLEFGRIWDNHLDQRAGRLAVPRPGSSRRWIWNRERRCELSARDRLSPPPLLALLYDFAQIHNRPYLNRSQSIPKAGLL